ncbi:MAG: hypothetical protein ACXAC6_15290 [Candidatus Hodarchaeales archaeon]
MKIAQKKYTIFLVFLFSQMIFLQSIQAETIFINNFWNTLGYGENSVLTDWSEAGRVDFSILGFTNGLYLKNDYSNLYLGLVILGDINESLIWRVNFDADADTVWAEDCKELTLTVVGQTISLSYQDMYYKQNDPDPNKDDSTDFSATKRNFSQIGNDYLILELRIPLLTNDFLSDFQVSNPESNIIGISIDVFNVDTAVNDTWRGGTYPNYADSSNFGQILFAGPQDRKIPIYEHEIPPTTTTTTIPETPQTTFDGETQYASASSFEGWISLLAIGAAVFMIRRHKRRDI